MRTTSLLTLFGAAALIALAGCTVKDVDQPALAGPSTFAHSIVMFAERNTLTQNGVDFTDIRVSSIGPDGQSEAVPLRAQVYVDGVPQDYGTLSTKNLVTPTTIRYTAPAASAIAAGQVAQTVTIAVTPTLSGDFRNEFTRQLDIRLEPQGVINPTNPNLAASFTVTPASPQVMQVATFDASATTNSGSPCLQQCSYAWDFGDGGVASGITATHQFRSAGNVVVTLTVTDARGATASKAQSVTIAPGTPPTVSFTVSPSNPGVNQTIFFNASASRPAAGRTLVSYEWDFGKGTTGTGVTVSKGYDTPGSYTVTLKVTDDAGAFAVATQTVTVGSSASLPTAVLTFSPNPPVGAVINFDASASRPASAPIVEYRFNWGDGTPDTVGTATSVQHTFADTTTITYIVRLTVTDAEGRQGTITVSVAYP